LTTLESDPVKSAGARMLSFVFLNRDRSRLSLGVVVVGQ
jgi:hypothetical protein